MYRNDGRRDHEAVLETYYTPLFEKVARGSDCRQSHIEQKTQPRCSCK